MKLFEENNFKLPRNFHHLYSDTNGVSLTWGHNSSPTEVKGHLGTEILTNSFNECINFCLSCKGFIKLECIVELGDDKYSLTDCKCCPRLSFDSNEHIYVQDRRGKWNFITDSLYNYFRLCLGKSV